MPSIETSSTSSSSSTRTDSSVATEASVDSAAGSTVVWAGIGGRYKFSPSFSVGANYEFALTNKNADIMDKRITIDFQVVF